MFKERLTAKMHGFPDLPAGRGNFCRQLRVNFHAGKNLRLDKHNIPPGKYIKKFTSALVRFL